MCVFSLLSPSATLTPSVLSLVYRVHWLRAYARAQRWQEEMTLTSNEMSWTLASFEHRARRWREYSDSSKLAGKFGHEYYANRQESTWKTFAENATQSFQRAVAAAGGDPNTIRPNRSISDAIPEHTDLVGPVMSNTASPTPDVGT